MRLVPVLGGGGFDDQRDFEGQSRVRGVDHDLFDQRDGRLDLALGHFEDQFVMDLQQET